MLANNRFGSADLLIFRAEGVGAGGRTLRFRNVTGEYAEEISKAESAKNAAQAAGKEGVGGEYDGQSLADGSEGVGRAFVDNPFEDSGKLRPDVKYKTGEFSYYYETDSLGRIEKFTTDDLRLTERTDRLSHNPNTPGKLPGDHAGHLAGDRFGGSAKLDNLVSQLSDFNLSQYKRIENQWARAINMGKKVKVDVEIKYGQHDLRPRQFVIRYEIDGKLYRKIIDN